MIEVKWFDDERTIVIYDFKPGWAVGDIALAFKEGNDLYQSVNYKIDMIFNVGSSRPINALSTLGRVVMNSKPINCGVSIIVTDNSIIANIVKLSKKIWRSSWEYKTSFDIESALEILEARKIKEIA